MTDLRAEMIADSPLETSTLTVGDGGVTADEEIEHIGLGKYHYVAGVICGIANAADAVELLAIGYIIPQLKDITSEMQGVVSAAIFAGMLIGGCCCGFLSDKYGRLPCLLTSLAINSIFGAISSATTGWISLSVCRIIAGIGVGGSIPSVFTLYMEYLPVQGRGNMLSIVATFWMVGSIYSAGVAWILLGVVGTSWRIYSLTAAIPACVACITGWLYLSESPRFLYSRQDFGACKKVLIRMARICGKQSSLMSGGHLVRRAPPAPHAATSSSRRTASTSLVPREPTFWQAVAVLPVKGMFWSPLRRTSLLLVTVWFTLSFGWYGLMLWIPSLFDQAEISLDMYQDAFVVAAANLPGNLLTLFYLDRIGRKRTLWISMTASAMLAMLFAFSHNKILVVVVASLLNCISTSGWNALDCLSTESFPTSLRTSAMGILAASGRVGSMVGQLIFGWLIDVSVMWLLITGSLFLFVGAAASVMLPQETSGKQLAENVDDVPGDLDSGGGSRSPSFTEADESGAGIRLGPAHRKSSKDRSSPTGTLSSGGAASLGAVVLGVEPSGGPGAAHTDRDVLLLRDPSPDDDTSIM